MRRVHIYECCCCGSAGAIANLAAFQAAGCLCPECGMSAEIESRDVNDELGATLRAQGIASMDAELITVEFEPGYIRSSMELWKAALDMKIPVHDAFKIHFMENRHTLLEGYVKTGKAWLMMIRAMKVKSGAEALDRLRAEVEEFVTWSEDGLRALDALRPN